MSRKQINIYFAVLLAVSRFKNEEVKFENERNWIMKLLSFPERK